MKHKFIPAEESFQQWKGDPKYVVEYKALEKEFAIASTLIETEHKTDTIRGDAVDRRKGYAASSSSCEWHEVAPRYVFDILPRANRILFCISIDSSSGHNCIMNAVIAHQNARSNLNRQETVQG